MFRLPLWIDLSLHLLPTAVLFIGTCLRVANAHIPPQSLTRSPTRPAEFFVRERKYRAPVSTVGAVLFTAMFSLSYTGWIEYRGASDGKCEIGDRLCSSVYLF